MSDGKERSHPNCHTEAGHVCQKPSGRTCIERGCDQPAGTLWGPHWCTDHDVERLDRISVSLENIAKYVINEDVALTIEVPREAVYGDWKADD